MAGVIEVGTAVRIKTGLWAGRTGKVVGSYGAALTVEFTGPRLLLDPAGPLEVKRLPYAAAELERESVNS